MISLIWQMIVIFLVILVLEWKNLKKESKRSRVLFFLFLALSGGIWIYLSSTTHFTRLADILEKFII
jgi:phosphate starvation-inducible membrane PsiE